MSQNHPTTRREIPDRTIASYASEYRETADHLYKQMRSRRINCISPLLVIASFGIELYLKSLNSQQKHQPDQQNPGATLVTSSPLEREHDFEKLLKPLDRFSKSDLDTVYKANPCVKDKATFEEALTKYKNLFIETRYAFENTTESVVRFGEVMGLLRLVAGYVESKLPPQEVSPQEASP